MSVRKQAGIFEAFARWCYDERGLAPKTRRTYLLRVKAAEMWLQEHRGVSILWAKPKDFQAYLWSTPPSPRNRNNIRQALVLFGDWLVSQYNEGGLNPALALKRIPEPRPVPKPLSGDQLRQVLRVADQLDAMRTALVFGYALTGMRREELRRLEWAHFTPDLSALECWVSFHYKSRGGRARERTIPVDPRWQRRLVAWRALSTEPRWVFPRLQGYADTPVSERWISETIRDIGEQAGIPGLHPHRFRHTLGTAMSDAEVPLEVIQEMLGHADPKTTRVYVNVHPKRLRDALSRLDFCCLLGLAWGSVAAGVTWKAIGQGWFGL